MAEARFQFGKVSEDMMKKVSLAKYLANEPFDNDELAWKWFGSLRFQGSPSFSAVYRLYFDWFKELEHQEGKLCVDFVRIVERRLVEGNFRFYVLVGGDRIESTRRAMLRWPKLGGGKAFLHSYRPSTFCHYVLNHVREDSDVELFMDVAGCFWIF